MEMSAGVGLEVGNGFNLDSWDGNMDQMELSMWPGASVCPVKYSHPSMDLFTQAWIFQQTQ